jgi:TRAP-type C4-dicarboxylate transport system substrate-binding protein
MLTAGAITRRTALGVGLAFVAAASGSVQAQEEFILAHGFGTDHFTHPVGLQFSEVLEELSNGAMVVDYHPGGDLGDYIQQFEQAMRGGIPMTLTGPATDMEAKLNIGYLAYVVDDWDSARELYGPGGSMIEIMGEVLDDLNLELIGMIPGGFGGIAVRQGVDRRPTSFPEDGAGFKMRVPPFEIGVKRFEAWGFSPMPIPYSELYTAMQLGTVDGRSFGPPTEIIEMRDAISAYIRTRDYFDTSIWVANKDWLAGLPDEQRGWIDQAADTALAAAWEEGERKEQEDLERIKEYGIEVIELTPEELEKAKTIVYETEWPWMSTIVGEELMADVRKAAGLDQ